MSTREPETDPFIDALREDLPTERDQARIRARLLAAGVIASTGLVPGVAAGGTVASGLLPKLMALPMFAKVDVKGPNAHQLFQYLTQAKPGILGTEAIKWNFTKFLIDRNGDPVARYAPQTKPEELKQDIEKLL